MYRTSLSCAWLHSWLAGGRLEPLYIILVTTREAPHKQNHDQGAYVPTSNYDQGAYPQTELCTYVRLCRDLAGWLAELCMSVQPGSLSCAWLAGWLAGGLAGWLRPREAQRGGAWKEQACHALGWRPQKAYVTHTHAHTPGRSSACGNASGRLGALRKCLGMLQGGLGRLGEASGRLVGSAWEMIGGGLGRLGEACSVHARPLWGSLGGLGRLGAAWGMLGNASGRLGECLGMLREVRGGLGRLGEGLGNAL